MDFCRDVKELHEIADMLADELASVGPDTDHEEAQCRIFEMVDGLSTDDLAFVILGAKVREFS